MPNYSPESSKLESLRLDYGLDLSCCISAEKKLASRKYPKMDHLLCLLLAAK